MVRLLNEKPVYRKGRPPMNTSTELDEIVDTLIKNPCKPFVARTLGQRENIRQNAKRRGYILSSSMSKGKILIWYEKNHK